jgi:hypothetical protein
MISIPHSNPNMPLLHTKTFWEKTSLSSGYELYVYIDSFNLEYDRPRAITAADNHHLFIVNPALHDGTAQQNRIEKPYYIYILPCYSSHIIILNV